MLHEIEVQLAWNIADADDNVLPVTILFKYTPREDGRGPSAYAGGEPGHPAEVEIQYIYVRGSDGKLSEQLPKFMVRDAEKSPHIEQLMFDHVEGGL